MYKEEPLKNKIMSGQTVPGAMVFEFFSPGVSSILANAGAEFVLYDMEHTGLSFETLKWLFASCRGLPITPMVRVPRGDTAAALRAITDAHAPATAPWSRCPACNVALHVRSAFEARGEVPGRVTRQGLRLTWCPSCARWFWPGSHVARLSAWFEQVLGRPVPFPAPPGGSPTEPSEPTTGQP